MQEGTIRLRAHDLRRNQTEAERRLWSALRNYRLSGFKFRRQQPIGNYIVDFVCQAAKLVIELDGSQHSDEEQLWYDHRRTKWLNAQGYEVVRFNNYDVLKHPYQVLEAIDARVRPLIRPAASAIAPDAVHLLPQGEKGKMAERDV